MQAAGQSFELRCALTTDEYEHSRSVAVRAGAMLRASLERKHATCAFTPAGGPVGDSLLRRLCE